MTIIAAVIIADVLLVCCTKGKYVDETRRHDNNN